MSDEFFESLGNIKTESMAMLKNLKAVRGESYARLVHSIILAEQIDQVGAVIYEISKQPVLSEAVSNMISKIMDYYMRSTGFSQAELESAVEDATRIMSMTYGLVEKASVMAEQGQVLGGE